MSKSVVEIYEVFLQSGKVSTDTRNIIPGSIFFALKGERFDGNKFALDALKNGCVLAVVDDEALIDAEGCIVVPDVLKALQNLARHHRKHLNIPVIGITGTNGKTTTKELVAAVLSKKYNVWFTQGNFNNHIGVPLTLLGIPPATQIAVIEMGANHVGEIAGLCSIAQPDHGLITNVGKAHLEGFGSFEGVKKGKGELYSFLKDNGGEIFINVDNSHLMEMIGEYPWIGYGQGDGAVVKASEISADPLLRFLLTTSRVERKPVQTCLTGLYNLDNVLAAASIGHYFGVEEELVIEAVDNYVPQNNRSQYFNSGKNQVLLDAYNANPSSMSVALENFKAIHHEPKILVLGSMKELGDDSLSEHNRLIETLESMDFEACYLTGTEFRDVVPDDKRFCWFKDTSELRAFLEKQKIRNALFLIKGSRANRLESVAEVL
jgi:UDP-N-acetylmuramoyl-tripeptide--D-alanyl-D-alanine ligase